MCAHATQEDTLGDVAKKAGGFALGALIGKGGSKFGGLDIKRVYFGCVPALLSVRDYETLDLMNYCNPSNWLRAYSQVWHVS